MSNIRTATKDRIIHLNRKTNTVTYLASDKSRSLDNPEEKVQLDTYLEIIYGYGYPPERVKVCTPVKMGSATKEADIIIYNDDDCNSPYIIVECKKKGVSENVFTEAIDQGFSYASATLAKYIWVTDGNNNAYFEVLPNAIGERSENKLHDMPAYDSKSSVSFKVKKAFKTTSIMPAIRKAVSSPLFLQTLSYSLMFISFMVLFSKLLVMHFTFVYNHGLEYFWENHNASFRSIFNIMTFVSAGLSILIAFRLRLFPAQIKVKKSTVLLLTILLFIPIWFIGTEYRMAWWNWQHYSDMKHKTWIYLEPMLLALPLQMIIMAGILWISERSFSKASSASQRRKTRA